MAPQQKSATTEEEIPPNIRAGMVFASPPKGEEVVISGIAGCFPESENVRHFRDNLMGKVDMVTDKNMRWTLENPEIPNRHGKIPHITKFDAAFFGIHYKQAEAMDPMCRHILERAYEAVLDAGINPYTLRGSRVGVFVGACFSESEKTWFYEKLQINGYAITGCSRVMLANRISYWLGVNGPSYAVDSACSSSLYAMEHAYKAIRGGHCDSAIVGGCNLCLHPFVTLQFARLGVLSMDGACRAFDNKANGYARSEAIAVIYLQKAKDCKRIYATVLHAKTNCDGYKEEGITYPSGLMQQKLLEEFYAECKVDPTTLGFIEAHGTGTKVGDPEELNAIDKVLCKGRQTPLPIGSVKSNIGHSEPASGLCSITKAVIAFEEGLIPPNLHYDTHREGVEALETGRLQVVTDAQKLDYGLIGVNSFGFGGANCHILLRWNEKVKVNGSRPSDSLPRLVVVSGRTEEAVLTILQDVESRPVDVEYVRLLHDIHASDIPGHLYRGFFLAGTDKIKSQMDVEKFSEVKPLWLVFSGLHSQWPRVGKSLFDLPAFSATIGQLTKVLKPKGIDIASILEAGDDKMFDNCLLSVVATTAIQVGLVDVLKKLKITPQGIVGYSTGEIACAYACRLITAEQAILTAYSCGLAHVESVPSKGATAEVELGHKDLAELLLPGVEVVVHSSPQRSVISGPTDVIAKCVASLRKSGVSVSDVKPSNNMFHHSHFSARGNKKLLSLLKEVIPQPQALSQELVGCSPPSEKLLGAEYFTHALSSPVLLQEAVGNIPRSAVVVEVAPHGYLQDALELALHKSVVNFALLDGNLPLESLLVSIGRLYQHGAQPHLAEIYPEVKFPVSRGTPMISPLVRWNHSQDWFVTSYELQEKTESGERTVPINLSEENCEFYSGHVIDGRNLFAATGYLVLVWETLALMSGNLIKDVPIVFENVRFMRATNIPKEGTIEFVISIQKFSGNFEIVESGVAIVTGRCYVPKSPSEEMDSLDVPEPVDSSLIDLSRRDIYKELRLRGYNYSGLFRSIISADNLGNSGKVQWSDNWVAFMDCILQMQVMQEDTRGLFVPTSIDKIVVDPKKHLQEIETDGEIEFFPVYLHKEVGLIHSGGIEIKGMKVSGISRRKPLGEPVLEKYLFVPHYKTLDPPLPITDVLRMCVHITLENNTGIKVKTVEVASFEDGKDLNLFANEIAAILEDLPLIQADITVVTPPGKGEIPDLSPNVHVEDRNLTGHQNCLMIIASNVIGQKTLLETAVGALSPKGFLIAREKLDSTPVLMDPTLKIVLDLNSDGERIILLKKVTPVSDYAVIRVENDSFSWIPELQKAIKEANNERIILVSERDPLSGLIGLENCIRKEPGGETVSGVAILDPEAPPFSLTEPLYRDELEKDLAMIVYKDGEWGSYRHLKMGSLPPVNCPHAYVNIGTRGDLSTLQWYQGELDEFGNPKRPDGTLIHIYYAALNFRDIMTATGKITAEVVSVGRLNSECVQGLEFSGRDVNGRRYMGMLPEKAMATMTYADPGLLWEIPDSWTLEDAATIPVVYGTAYFALFLNGRMQKGESVLIHAGSGGVGQAAITLALKNECVVFTTVGTPEKRAFIKERFPQLTDRHIGNSRDTSFEQLIMEETEGRGVDLVLNSLAEEKLQASVRCLAPGGRFLEIGKFDLSSNNPLGMEVFLRGTSFHGVTLEKMFYKSHEWKDKLNKLMKQGLASGEIEPLTRTTFQADEIEPAFRYMAAGKHIGKVLVKVRQDEEVTNIPPKTIFVQATRKFFCNYEKSYIVSGGLGGFGLELVDWLIVRGARRILLTSRTGVRTGYQCSRIRVWRTYGVMLRISTADISTEEGVESIIREAAELGPVEGIFNLAVVLHDAIFENQTEELFAKSAAPKSVATHHLDRVSRRLCPELKHFVVFSSVSCGRGNPGQTNYGMFNSVMERICEARVNDGLPGLAVQWGAVGEVGLVAEMQEEQHELVIGGTLQQKISSCMAVLDQFMMQSHPVVASMVVAEKRASGYGSGGIVECVANIMGIRDLKTVSLHSTLAELGMDSMMAVEIKQSLERDFEVFLTPQDVRSMTFARLAEIASAATAEGDAPTAEQDAAVHALEIDLVDISLMVSLIGDEAIARLPIVQLQSAVDPADKSGPLVIMLPGIEGMAQVFNPLATNLLYRTHSLQLKHNDYSDTVPMLIDELYPVVKENLPANEPFNIIGYSYGGILALDVVNKLEEEGLRGKLVLVDSSPDYLQELCKIQIQMGSEDAMQVNLLLVIVSYLAPQSSNLLEQIKSDIEKLETWKDRLEYLMNIQIHEKFVHTSEYVFSIATSLYARIRALLDYEYGDTKRKIQSETILIRPKRTIQEEEDDYGLSKICKDLKIYDVDGDHRSILGKMECADLINNFFAGVNLENK